MRSLTSREAEFAELAERSFDFLVAEHGCRIETETLADGIVVRLRNRWAAIELQLEGDERVFATFVPLDEGQMPALFDDQGRDVLSRFSLSEVIRERDPAWRPPERADSASNREEMTEVLRQYAVAFREHGSDLLRGARETVSSIEGTARRRLISMLMSDWERFVERVGRGFSGGIGEYTMAVTSRGQLEGFLQGWKVDDDVRRHLADLDRSFDEATEPAGTSMNRTGAFTVLPAGHALRWWRRPRKATGELAAYFSART